MDKILHEYFKDAPPLMEMIERNISMVFLNSHSVISDAKPLVPSMVEIGGFHIEDPKPLPKVC